MTLQAGQFMLKAITPALIFLLEQLSEARKARAAEGKKQTTDEIVDDSRRRQLTDYLYALSDQGERARRSGYGQDRSRIPSSP
jgi:hypothetical protein